jgi:hypothetical protein
MSGNVVAGLGFMMGLELNQIILLFELVPENRTGG